MDLRDAIRTIPDYPKPGILFYDLTTLLQDGKGFHALVEQLCDHYRGQKVDIVAGIEARGFILGGAVGSLFGVLNLFTGVRNQRRHQSKFSPYECWLPSEIQRGFRFGISFYLIAMLFILFDIEVIFLYPVAVQLKAFGTFALVETIVFIAMLLVACAFSYRSLSRWRRRLAGPGRYTLRSTGEVVEDPDMTTSWTIHEPSRS